MNADVAARLREFGQYLDDVDEAFEFVAQTYLDALDNDGGLQDVIDTLLQVKA